MHHKLSNLHTIMVSFYSGDVINQSLVKHVPEHLTPWAISPHMKLAQCSHQWGPLKVWTCSREHRDRLLVMKSNNNQRGNSRELQTPHPLFFYTPGDPLLPSKMRQRIICVWSRTVVQTPPLHWQHRGVCCSDSKQGGGFVIMVK